MRILVMMLCALLMVTCKQQGNTVSEQENLKVAEDSIMDEPNPVQMTIYEGQEHRIYLEKVNGEVYCYADSQRVVFNDDMLDGGAIGIYYHQPDNSRYIYIIGATSFNGKGGWETGFHLYQMDVHRLSLKHIGNFAGIRFEDNGFKAATARLLNPNAECKAVERYAIRDYFFDNNGKLIKKGKNEYESPNGEYDEGLVNVVGIGFMD